MTQLIQDQLQKSLTRCFNTTGFLDTFYDILFQKAPKMKEHFQHVDMDLQKERLAARLPMLIGLPSLDPDSPELAQARLEHKARHAHGRRENYELWIESVCETFRRHDDLFTPDLEANLRETLTTAIDLLKEPTEPVKLG